MSRKRKSSEVVAESAPPAAPEARVVAGDGVIIKAWDTDGDAHYIDWTRLIKKAPTTCLMRAFDDRGEQIHVRRHTDYHGWFLSALCKYINDDSASAKFTVMDENISAAAEIFSNLCVDIDDDLAMDERLVRAISRKQNSQFRISELKKTAALLLLELINTTPHDADSAFTPEICDATCTGITLTTAVTDFGRAQLVRRFYCVVKALGAAAKDYGPFTYGFSTPVCDSLKTWSTVACRVYGVETSPEGAQTFTVKFNVIVRQYELESTAD